LPQGWPFLVVLLGFLVLAAWQASTNVRLNRMVRHYRNLAVGVEGQPLDQLLQRILDRADIEQATLRELEERISVLGVQVTGHLQNVGLVRYNAFDDTGGDHSFALALLDAHGNGALVNGLYHRDVSRVYAKPIRDWKSTYSLSDEERESIRKAQTGGGPTA
jgi:hypothetical protein